MSLLDDVSIVVTPNGYKARTLFGAIPVPTFGSDEITNGGFATDSDWSKGGGWSIGGGVASHNGNSNSNISQNISLTIGSAYSVTYTVVNASAGSRIGISTNATSIQIERTANGTYTETFTASLSSFYIRALWNNGSPVSLDNVSVKEWVGSDMDVTRATDATRVDENGLIEDVLANVPRIDYTGGGCPHILAEPMRTNLVFPSDVAVTQTRTVTAVEYALSFYGTGSIVLSGTHSATLAGTGANDRVDLIFTPTAGSLVLTVSGTVTNFQLEVGSYATSLIPTVSGQVTRNQDIFTRDGIGSLINSTEGVLFIEMAALSDDGTDRRLSLSNGTVGNAINIGLSRFSGNINAEIHSGGVLQTSGWGATGVTQTNNNKFALSWGSGAMKFYVNGSPTSSQTGVTSPIGLNNLKFSSGDDTLNMFGKVKQLQVYKTALSDTQLADLTS